MKYLKNWKFKRMFIVTHYKNEHLLQSKPNRTFLFFNNTCIQYAHMYFYIPLKFSDAIPIQNISYFDTLFFIKE